MICAIVLAAGQSRRMGRQKLLLPLGGRPVITRIVDETLRGPVSSVFVVTSPDRVGFEVALADRPVHFVTNPNPNSQMLDSVRCGWRALPEPCVAALIILGDQPGLTSGMITGLVQAFQTTRRGLVVPVQGGRRGHPLLISMQYREEILTGHDETGLKGLLQAHPEDVLEVEMPATVGFDDMDLPDDYQRMAARFSNLPDSSGSDKV